MRRELKNAFGKVYLTVEVDTLNRWVYANWIGYSTEASIKAGVIMYTELLGADLNCMLIDTRSMIGTWDHSLEWMLSKWAPRAAKAGLAYYALVANPGTFAESTADDFHARVSLFQARVFDDMEAAKDWLSPYAMKNTLGRPDHAPQADAGSRTRSVPKSRHTKRFSKYRGWKGKANTLL